MQNKKPNNTGIYKQSQEQNEETWSKLKMWAQIFVSLCVQCEHGKNWLKVTGATQVLARVHVSQDTSVS